MKYIESALSAHSIGVIKGRFKFGKVVKIQIVFERGNEIEVIAFGAEFCLFGEGYTIYFGN